MADPHSMPDLLPTTAELSALSALASQRVEVPPCRSFTAAGLSVPLIPSFGPGPCTSQGQSSQTCTLPPNHAAPGPIPSAGSGCGAFGLDNSGDAPPPTKTPTDPRLDPRPVRIDAPRTAYRVYSSSDQPPLGAHAVCAVPPRTRALAVTRDSRNRSRRKRKVRSPYPHEEGNRPNLHIKCGDYRTASRTPVGYTRGPTPPNISATNNNNYQLGFMTQNAERGAATAASAEHRSCTTHARGI
jgi:hypothetical protein